MRKSKTILKGFISAHFFRHSAGIAVFMLFGLSLMSFRYDDGKKPGISNSSKDSTERVNNKGLAGLLGEFSDVTEDKSIFKLRPSMVSFVKSFTKRESEEFKNMKAWGKPYFELYDKILTENGLPVELKYLSVIESGLVNTNVTGGSAVGPWQLMPDEGRRFGLKMRKSFDERTSFTKSTEVAAHLLKELHEELDNWLLVIGAYNCGLGRMKQAIAKAGSSDYWKLEQYLPQETRNHVKKFIATHYIFEGCGGWTTITTSETAACKAAIAKRRADQNSALMNNIAASSISGKYSSSVIIRSLAIDPALFKELNPAFDKTLTEGKTYSLRLPQSKMPLFITNRQQILEKSAQAGLTGSVTSMGS